MRQQCRQLPLGTRLYLEPALHELAKFVNYGGRRTKDVDEFMVEHRKKHGSKAALALDELTMLDPKTCLTVLSYLARKACRVLLGPPPESPEYADYWKARNREPPPEHQPPQDRPTQNAPTEHQPPGDELAQQEQQTEPAPSYAGGISKESYAARAAEKNRRQLLCMLRDSRKKLDHHGKRSFCGKEAKKELEAALAELAKRGIEPPPPGQETAEWDTPKSPEQQPARKRAGKRTQQPRPDPQPSTQGD